MKLRLNALLFSMYEYAAIRNWSKKNSDFVEVLMPAGIAPGQLVNVLYLPDILGDTISGVLIADHKKYSSQQLENVVKILEDRNKKLYSVANGSSPVLSSFEPHTEQTEAPSAKYADTPILQALVDCRQALRWLYEEGPTQAVPVKHSEPIKRLEKLGFVFRRNNKTVTLRRHRLTRVLEHESKKLSFACCLDDFVNPAKTGIIPQAAAH